jgi:hypothetical protein
VIIDSDEVWLVFVFTMVWLVVSAFKNADLNIINECFIGNVA